MTWAKLDDHLPTNRKWRRVVKKSPAAGCLWVASICYSARYLTDGRIPKDELDEVAPVKAPEKLARLLVEEGLFEDHGDAWFVHDYLQWNLPAEEVRARQEADRLRKARQRQKGARGVTNGPNGQFVPADVRADEPPDETWDDPPDGGGSSTATRPVPSRPSPPSSSSDSRPPAGPDDDDMVAKAIEAEVDRQYAERNAPDVVAKKGQVRVPATWKDSARRALQADFAVRGWAALAPPPPSAVEALLAFQALPPCPACDSTGWRDTDAGVAPCDDCKRVNA